MDGEEGDVYLPDDVLLLIFGKLSFRELGRVARVCHQWHRVVERCWKNFFLKTFFKGYKVPMHGFCPNDQFVPVGVEDSRWWKFQFRFLTQVRNHLTLSLPKINEELLDDNYVVNELACKELSILYWVLGRHGTALELVSNRIHKFWRLSISLHFIISHLAKHKQYREAEQLLGLQVDIEWARRGMIEIAKYMIENEAKNSSILGARSGNLSDKMHEQNGAGEEGEKERVDKLADECSKMPTSPYAKDIVRIMEKSMRMATSSVESEANEVSFPETNLGSIAELNGLEHGIVARHASEERTMAMSYRWLRKLRKPDHQLFGEIGLFFAAIGEKLKSNDAFELGSRVQQEYSSLDRPGRYPIEALQIKAGQTDWVGEYLNSYHNPDRVGLNKATVKECMDALLVKEQFELAKSMASECNDFLKVSFLCEIGVSQFRCELRNSDSPNVSSTDAGSIFPFSEDSLPEWEATLKEAFSIIYGKIHESSFFSAEAIESLARIAIASEKCCFYDLCKSAQSELEAILGAKKEHRKDSGYSSLNAADCSNCSDSEDEEDKHISSHMNIPALPPPPQRYALPGPEGWSSTPLGESPEYTGAASSFPRNARVSAPTLQLPRRNIAERPGTSAPFCGSNFLQGFNPRGENEKAILKTRVVESLLDLAEVFEQNICLRENAREILDICVVYSLQTKYSQFPVKRILRKIITIMTALEKSYGNESAFSYLTSLKQHLGSLSMSACAEMGRIYLSLGKDMEATQIFKLLIGNAANSDYPPAEMETVIETLIAFEFFDAAAFVNSLNPRLSEKLRWWKAIASAECNTVRELSEIQWLQFLSGRETIFALSGVATTLLNNWIPKENSFGDEDLHYGIEILRQVSSVTSDFGDSFGKMDSADKISYVMRKFQALMHKKSK
eukprot:Nk52_evm18s223 gene=Nk52_evmTU18s223